MATKIPTPLRLAIAASGRTQREVAEACGLKEPRLSQIVNGHWNADPETRSASAKALGRPEADLFPSAHEAAA
jgi:transcriptional regulator with XRE-family HTH domain